MDEVKRPLYEKWTDGDRKTIVRRYKKGGTFIAKDGARTSMIKFRTDVKVKVTQEFSVKLERWFDVMVDFENAVEVSPEDSGLPGAPMPIARTHVTWFRRAWRRIQAWFYVEAS